MPVNPITLDKLENTVIKNIEIRAVDRIVHEIKGAEINKENRNNNNNSNSFNKSKQEEFAELFRHMLSKYNIDLEYKVLKKKVKIKIKDKNGNILLDTELDDVEDIYNRVKNYTGNIIDLRG